MAPGASFLEIWKRLETLTPERCRAGGSPERKGYSIWLSFGTIFGPRLLQIASLFDVIFNVLFESVFFDKFGSLLGVNLKEFGE